MDKTKDKFKEMLGKFFFGVFLFAVWIFLCASVLSYSPSELPNRFVYSESEEVVNLAGTPGAWCACAIFNCFGVAGYLVVIAFGIGVVSYWRQEGIREPILKIVGFSLILTTASGAAAYLFDSTVVSPPVGPGGCAGALVKYLLEHYCVRFGAYLALFGIFVAGGILAGSDSVLRFFLWTTGIGRFLGWLTGPFRRKINESRPETSRRTPIDLTANADRSPVSRAAFDVDRNASAPDARSFVAQAAASSTNRTQLPQSLRRPISQEAALASNRRPIQVSTNVPASAPNVLSPVDPKYDRPVPLSQLDADEPEPPKRSLLAQAFGFGAKKNVPEPPTPNQLPYAPSTATVDGGFANAGSYALPVPTPAAFIPTPASAPVEYVYPSFDLLAGREHYDLETIREKILERGTELERVFKSFGVEVKVVDVQTGPVLTLYEIELKAGLRVKNIHALTNDLEIAMKAPRVRIVSPIPGKNTVGVELPNENRQLVRLREVMEECSDASEKMNIPIFLGKDVVGTPMVADLAKLPHLLIAGRTGTGKSVCLNSIIMSILMTRSPSDVKLILIDPKMVELSPYKSIPHLMHPVVVDMKKAEAILEWAVEKMESRYQIFAKVGARKLSEFNNMSQETLRRRLQPRDEEEWAAFPKSMPSVVIVADEMADLIMTSGKDVERHIVRLAQKSRAVGIHLVLATQKPTVDVVTGLIKSNLPARIAFGVASRTDSQVVLDAKGAEQLLGNGDMLFLLPGTSQLVRGQGTFVSDKEIDSVIDAISVDEPDFDVVIEDENAVDEADSNEIEYDEYYVAAVDACIAEGRASTSLLQRKFSIGYNRAARIVDAMTAEGIVSPPNPAKPSRPRDILITMEQWRGRQDDGPDSPQNSLAAPTPYPTNAPPRPAVPSVNFGAIPQNAVVDVRASVAASTLVPGAGNVIAAASNADVDEYRPTSYESTPIATPEARAAEREAVAHAKFQEIDLSPASAKRSNADAPPTASAKPERRPFASAENAAEPPKNAGWNDEQWAKYLNYDSELDDAFDLDDEYEGDKSKKSQGRR